MVSTTEYVYYHRVIHTLRLIVERSTTGTFPLHSDITYTFWFTFDSVNTAIKCFFSCEKPPELIDLNRSPAKTFSLIGLLSASQGKVQLTQCPADSVLETQDPNRVFGSVTT